MTAKIKSHKNKTGHQHKPKGVSSHQFEKVYWPYLPVLLIILFLAAFNIQSGTLQAIVRHPSGKVLSYATSMSINSLLADTNAARVDNGIHSLHLNSQLDAAAQAKANDMAARDYWSHYTPDGNPPWVFVTRQGYSYQKLGENLAAGFSSEQATINGWMASPPHRENLLDSAFSDVGFGFVNIANYTAAGGGPMTLVVAFYGEPFSSPAPVASTPHTSTPVAAAPTSSSSVAPATAPKPSTKSSPPSSSKTAAKKPANPTPAPTTQSLPSHPTAAEQSHGVTLAFKASRADLVFAHSSKASFASGVATFILFAAGGLWISRHLLTLRRVFAKGESFVIKHPLMDAGLIVIAGLAYFLTQTAGFIQ